MRAAPSSTAAASGTTGLPPVVGSRSVGAVPIPLRGVVTNDGGVPWSVSGDAPGGVALSNLLVGTTLTTYAARIVGACEGVVDTWYAIGTERRIQHPLVQRMLGAAG